MGADHLVATLTIASNLRGEFPEGFNVNAVGGISLHSTGANVVNVPGDISYSAPVGGDVALFATSTDIHSQSDVNIWSATNGVFNVANDLTLNSIVGDFRIQSYLSTNIDAVNGIELGSLFRETTISAPNGIAELSTDIISFTAGDEDEPSPFSFYLLSNDTIDVRATKLFLIDSDSITFQTVENTIFASDVHNVEMEALHMFNITASDNVILKSVSDTHFETLLSDFTAFTNGVASLYGHGSFFYSGSIFLSSDNLVRLDSAGSVKFTDTTGTDIDASTINLTALPGDVKFTSTTGNIDIIVDELNVFSQNIDFTTSHVPSSSVTINTQAQTTFQTSNADIHFQSTFTELNSQGDTEFYAMSDVYLVAVRHSNQANLISPDGFSSYTADKGYTVTADEINLQSNGGIVFNDASEITLEAEKTLNVVSHNLYYQQSTFLIEYDATNAEISAGHDASFSGNSVFVSFYTDNNYASGEIRVTAEPDKESIITIDSASLTFYSSEGGAYFDAENIKVTATHDINFENDWEDNQEFKVNAAIAVLVSSGSVAYSSGTSTNLLAPTGAISTTSVGVTQFSGNEGIFKSITGSMHFNQGTFTANGDTINFRAGEKVTWHSEGYTIDMTATALEFESGVGIDLTSPTLSLSSDHDVNFEADSVITVLSQGDLPFISGTSIYVQGGLVTFDTEGNFTVTTDNMEISSSNSHDISFFTNRDLYNDAEGDITFTSGETVYTSSQTTDLDPTGDLTFTSNNDGAITFSSDEDSIIINNSGNTTFTSDFFNSYSYGDFNVDLNHDYVLNADYADIESENNVQLVAGAAFTITGVNMDTTLAPFQFDFGTYTIQGTNQWTSCNDFIRLNVGQYTYTSEGSVPIYQRIDPCGTCPGNGAQCEAGNFEIVSRSNRTQTINTNYVSYIGDQSININGGALLFRTLDAGFGSINFTTDNGVTFASKNYPSYLTGAGDDVLTASGNLNITINGAAEFVSNGFDNNFAYPNYGILMETTVNPLYGVNTNYTIKVPNGQINEHAAKILRIATLQPLDDTDATLTPQTPSTPVVPFLGQYQDLTVAVTRDILFDGGLGSITVISGGQLIDEDDDEFQPNAAINFLAVVGDITARADLAKMTFNDKYLFSATSLTDSITFTSLLDQTHVSQRKDGDLLYHSEFGKMTFSDKLDTSIIAGSPTQDASIDASSTNQIYVTSGQSQVYYQNGAVTDPTGIAINIIGDEGGILGQTPSDIDFYSSARVEVTAATGILTLNINNDIDFIADGRIDYVSQLTSNFTVSDGNIDVNANGGGGSVSINSDDGQDITGLAGQGISVTAASDASIYAIAGITALSHTGDISLSNSGVNQDMFFLSQGSVRIEAVATAGVSISGLSFHADAFQDVLFDSNFFSVDSTSDTTTATEPIIEIHAGGDTKNEGIIVNSVGQMQWTTSKAAGVHMIGDKIDFETGVDIKMNTNGPILFENKGEEDEGVFTITTTTGTLTINGNENAAIAGITEAQFNTENSITLQSIGTDAGDGVQIHSRRNLEINSNEFDMTTNILEAELSDFQVNAENLITIQNTIGDGGSISIASDLNLDLLSTGPIVITSSGSATIATYGKIATINFDSQSDQTLNSGDSTFFNAVSMDTEAPEGITFTSTGGAIEMTASDDVTFQANNTLTVIGRSSLQISTGALDSSFLISSTGDASFVASNDLTIDSSAGEIYVLSDAGITIDNRVPTKPRDQGDIFIESYGTLKFATGNDKTDDATYTVGRYYAVTVDANSRLLGYGDVSFTATKAGASILLTAEAGAVDVESGDVLSFNVGGESTGTSAAFIATATQDLTWEQTYEEGFGGITMTSSGSSAPFTITSGGTSTFESVNSIQGSSPKGYISFFSDNFMSIGSLNSEGDIVFNALQADVNIDAGASFIYGPNNAVDEYKVVIESFLLKPILILIVLSMLNHLEILSNLRLKIDTMLSPLVEDLFTLLLLIYPTRASLLPQEEPLILLLMVLMIIYNMVFMLKLTMQLLLMLELLFSLFILLSVLEFSMLLKTMLFTLTIE